MNKAIRNIITAGILLIISFIYESGEASFLNKFPGTRPSGMGGAFTAVADDINAVKWNPAGLGGQGGFNFTSFYEKLYNIDDLTYQYLAASYSLKKFGTWGFGYTRFGNSIYRENELNLSAGKEIIRDVYLGASFNYLMLGIDEETRLVLDGRTATLGGSVSAIGLDAGILVNLSEKFACGVYLKNVNQPLIGLQREALPVFVAVGAAYKPYKELLVSLDLKKAVKDDANFKSGVEYRFSKYLACRMGVETRPARFSAGASARFRFIGIDYAFITHPELASSHHIAFNLFFGKEVEKPVEVKQEKKKQKPARITTETEGAVPSVPSEKKKPRLDVDIDQLGVEADDSLAVIEPIKDVKPEDMININTADVETLNQIPGISLIKAKKIIEYRVSAGKYKAVDDLLNVSGISKKLLDNIRQLLIVDEKERETKKQEGQPGK